MSAKKLGRFTAGLFVALGLAFGGAAAASAGGSGATASLPALPNSAVVAQFDYDWS
ncbi:hypothetical protein GCM10020358_03690 [Amorphoplanes nipponensis]|uniref:Chitinase n=1 Tax=Actinoplanes nipponensis TaxID=135950 RepID=A0A919JQV3_9ACTN|nr:hypothetical protein [Actinoplanes nipponensis]GIE54098.1 hypothetical protein Ani05nite_76320 [Actinoplanes nipponensis]